MNKLNNLLNKLHLNLPLKQEKFKKSKSHLKLIFLKILLKFLLFSFFE